MKLNSGMHLSQVKNQWNDENRKNVYHSAISQ